MWAGVARASCEWPGLGACNPLALGLALDARARLRTRLRPGVPILEGEERRLPRVLPAHLSSGKGGRGAGSGGPGGSDLGRSGCGQLGGSPRGPFGRPVAASPLVPQAACGGPRRPPAAAGTSSGRTQPSAQGPSSDTEPSRVPRVRNHRSSTSPGRAWPPPCNPHNRSAVVPQSGGGEVSIRAV